MDRLAEFQRHHLGTSDLTRHTVDAIIRRAKQDYGERGWRLIDATIMSQIVLLEFITRKSRPRHLRRPARTSRPTRRTAPGMTPIKIQRAPLICDWVREILYS